MNNIGLICSGIVFVMAAFGCVFDTRIKMEAYYALVLLITGVSILILIGSR